MKLAALTALLAFASIVLVCHANREIPSRKPSIQEAAVQLAALHVDRGMTVQPLQAPSQPAAAFDIQWPSPRTSDQAQLLSGGHSRAFKISKAIPVQPERTRAPADEEGRHQHRQDHLEHTEDSYDTSDRPEGGQKHAEEETPQDEETCLLANTLTFRFWEDGDDFSGST
jgi:hypothetical protein